MEKTIYTEEQKVFLRLLRSARKSAGLTQADLAACIGETQSWVSKCERGERRLDVLELRAFCAAFGVSLGAFVERLEAELARQAPSDGQ